MKYLTSDSISKLIMTAIDILMIKNPERTGYGILLGSVLMFLSKLFSPLFKQVSYMDIDATPFWGWITFGICITHLPFILWSIFHKSIVDDQIDSAIKIIEKGNFSENEKRQLFRKLVNKCVENVVLKKNTLDVFEETTKIIEK